MRFSKRQPKKEGYYWYRVSVGYSPRIGHLSKYRLAKGWFVIPFNSDVDENKSLTGRELWGKRIKEP